MKNNISFFFYFTLPVFILFLSPNTSQAENIITFNLWQGISYNFTVSDINIVQKYLIKNKYLNISSPTGYFGPKTFNSVLALQKDKGLDQNGFVGSLTRKLINSDIATKDLDDNTIIKNGDFSLLIGSSSPLKSVYIKVPLIEQLYPLSCEAASLQMALSYKGVNVKQNAIIESIGISEPIKKTATNNGNIIWGDPDLGFVGNIKGWMYNNSQGTMAGTGWGVNRLPIEKVAKIYRPDSYSMSGNHISDIIKEIDNNNSVIVWQTSDLPKNLLTLQKYQTSSGKTVDFKANHVSLVVGYNLNRDGSYSFLINDPEYGRIITDQKTFEANWNRYNRDMVVVK